MGSGHEASLRCSGVVIGKPRARTPNGLHYRKICRRLPACAAMAGTGVAASGHLSSPGADMQPTLTNPVDGARIEGTDAFRDSSGPGPEMMTASTLTGNNVVNLAGDELGEIEEIMLDVRRGAIAYAVMSSGGFLGIGEKLFAIPWSQLTLDTDRHVFVLDVPKDHFKDAPGFDKDNWPTQLNGGENWHRDVHAFYRTPVYWEKS
jgi:sporulation protein YlmC with PRC-barrel domain